MKLSVVVRRIPLASSAAVPSQHVVRATPIVLSQVRYFATPAKPAATPAAGGKTAAKGADKAKGAAGGKKKGGKESKLGNTLTAGSTGFLVGEKIPIGIFKDSPDPVVKVDKDYPEWLWKVSDLPTLGDCIKLAEQDKADGKPPNKQLYKRIERLRNNAKIKAYNASQM